MGLCRGDASALDAGSIAEGVRNGLRTVGIRVEPEVQGTVTDDCKIAITCGWLQAVSDLGRSLSDGSGNLLVFRR